MQFRTDKLRQEDELSSLGNLSGMAKVAEVKATEVFSAPVSVRTNVGTQKDMSFRIVDTKAEKEADNNKVDKPVTRLDYNIAKSSDRETTMSDVTAISSDDLSRFSSLTADTAMESSKNLFDVFGNKFNLRVSKVLVINILAIVGLVYAVVNIYLINERSKVAYQERQQASLSTLEAQAQYDVKVENASVQNIEAFVPARIEISKIGVNAQIGKMGVTKDNNIEAPESLYDAGWFTGSSKANEGGAAIIDGHLGSNIAPGIFWDLEDLEIGDTVSVYSESGESAHYVVRSTEVVSHDATDFDRYYSAVGDGNGLNIITCSGGYLQGEQTYDSRLIVYTEQVYT